MNDDQVREKLREAFRTFALPRTMPTPGFEAIMINGGRGRLCSICGELIPSTDEGSLEFKYPDGRRFAFHGRCEQLWQSRKNAIRWGGGEKKPTIMSAEMIESQVRQWLREHQGAAHCARCVATALLVDYESVRAAIEELVPRQPFSLGPCACGATGLRYGWSVG